MGLSYLVAEREGKVPSPSLCLYSLNLMQVDLGLHVLMDVVQ